MIINKIKIPKGSGAISLYLPLGKSFIYHSLAFSLVPAQIGNLKPLGTNEGKERHCYHYCFGTVRAYLGKFEREERTIKKTKKGKLPRIKLCHLGPPSHDSKAIFP